MADIDDIDAEMDTGSEEDIDSPNEADENVENAEKVDTTVEATKRDKVYKDDEELDDTIFIRNVARFETTQESLKAHIEENWGETVYCLICKDRETGESKGTAFVKFKDPYDAGACLGDFEDREQQQKFFLDGRNLFVLPALNRNQMGEVKAASAKKIDVLEKKNKVKKPRWYRTANKDNVDGSASVQSHNQKSSSPDQRGGKKTKVDKKRGKDLKPGRRSKNNQMAGNAHPRPRNGGGRVDGQGPNNKRKPGGRGKPHKVGGRPHAKNNKGSKKKHNDKFKKAKQRKG